MVRYRGSLTELVAYQLGDSNMILSCPGQTTIFPELGLKLTTSESGKKIAIQEIEDGILVVNLFTITIIPEGYKYAGKKLTFSRISDFLEYGRTIQFSRDEKTINVGSVYERNPTIEVYHHFWAKEVLKGYIGSTLDIEGSGRLFNCDVPAPVFN